MENLDLEESSDQSLPNSGSEENLTASSTTLKRTSPLDTAVSPTALRKSGHQA
jgi:hypothetical protein